MVACKSQYDYSQLCFNYIEHNKFNNIYKEKHSSTANNRLSFSANYLYSYQTIIANFVIMGKHKWCLITNENYSATTNRQIETLIAALNHWKVPYIKSDNIHLNTINSVFDSEYKKLLKIYKSLPSKRNMLIYKYKVEEILDFFNSQLNFYPAEVKPFLDNINKLPNIPDKMDAFIRPVFKSELKRIGLLND